MTPIPIHRRAFLAVAGASTAGLVLSACGEDEEPTAQTTPTTTEDEGADLTLDFSTPVGVLNYALALEVLESSFYAAVLADPFDGITDRERETFTDIQAHEAVHAEFLQAVLGGDALAPFEPDLSSVDLGSRDAVLETALVLENTGVGAYNGAARYLPADGPLGAVPLMAAGDIVSVEARHASVIEALGAAGRDGFATGAFDEALTPQEVLQRAEPFLPVTIQIQGT